MRPINTAQIGDVLTSGSGMWIVDGVDVTEEGKVRLFIRAGRTDSGHWTPPHHPDKEVDLYTPYRLRGTT